VPMPAKTSKARWLLASGRFGHAEPAWLHEPVSRRLGHESGTAKGRGSKSAVADEEIVETGVIRRYFETEITVR
jgi:hypothetical protein